MSNLTELHFINLVSVLLVGTVLVVPHNPLRVGLGLPFVFLFPGYALVSGLYPRRNDLGTVERLMLSMGTSLAIASLIGLALNYLPWGIRLGPVLVSLVGVTLVCSIWATRSRARIAHDERAGYELAARWTRPPLFSAAHSAVVMAVIVLVASVAWRISIMPYSSAVPFTEFYLLGPSGKADKYPSQIRAGASGEVILGVTNHERRRVIYRISVRENGRMLTTLRPVALQDGQAWRRNVTFRPMQSVERAQVEFLLFKDGVPAPYRRLNLWVHVLRQESQRGLSTSNASAP